jgi:prolyl 4-hydroxylase
MSVVADAERQAAGGDIAGAVRRLEGASSDVEALALLANWLLVGSGVPRDLPRARALLTKAATIGHVDAALMVVAFTANGTGGDADWPAAVRLLELAAVGDPIAAEQLALLRAMRLKPDGSPPGRPASRRLSDRPDIRHFPGLFSPAECAHVASVAGDLLEPSMIVDPVTRRARPDPIRTSDAAVIGPARETLVVRALNRRIAAASATDVDAGEPLTVLRYVPGQEYRLHHDALPGVSNQRAWTMLVYLNEGYRGGQTGFPASGLQFQGRGGDGLLFANLDSNGVIDPAAQHAGLAVTAGAKWLCTRWIRQQRYDPWNVGAG